MQISRISFLGALTLAAASFLAPAYAEPEQSAAELKVLLLATNQRYLSQQAMKAYAQLGANVAPDKAGATLRQAMTELQSNFSELRQAAPAAVAPQLEQQRKLMDQLAGAVAQPPATASLAAALKTSDDLLTVSESTVKAIAGNHPQAPLLIMAARQRVVSQRVAASYFLLQTGAKSADLRRRMDSGLQEFHNLISTFEDHKGDIPEIEKNIDLARMQMVFLESALSAVDNANPRQMSTVGTASERVLSQMVELTKAVQKYLEEQAPRPQKKKVGAIEPNLQWPAAGGSAPA